MIEILEKEKSIIFDAVYSTPTSGISTNFYYYDQIYEDFDLSSTEITSMALVISALCLDSEDIRERSDDKIGQSSFLDLIISSDDIQGYSQPMECYCNGIPISTQKYPNPPVVLLVHHPIMSEKNSSFSLYHVANFIENLSVHKRTAGVIIETPDSESQTLGSYSPQPKCREKLINSNKTSTLLPTDEEEDDDFYSMQKNTDDNICNMAADW